MRIAARGLALSIGLLGGCSDNTVEVQLNFPSEAAFAQSSNARLRIFPRMPEELGTCPELIALVESGSFPTAPRYDSGALDVCEFRAGYSVPELSEGPHAFLVDVEDGNNGIIMIGCRIAEVYVGAPDVQVTLATTNSYSPTTMPSSASVRCGGAR